MKRFLLAFPGARFAVDTPRQILSTLLLFYPHAEDRREEDGVDVRFEIRRREDSWTLLRDGVSAGDFPSALQALFALEYEIETALIKLNRDLLALHAGAVATTEGACLIAGDADQGKTSTTFQLVELGHAFLCEEVALVEVSTLEVHPYLQTLSLGHEFLEDFQRHFPVEHGQLHSLLPRIQRYLPLRQAQTKRPLHTILLPRFVAGTDIAVEHLSPDEILTEFLHYCFEPNVDEEDLFDDVIRLLERCRLLRFSYGSAATAREALAALFPSPDPPPAERL